MPYLSDEDLRRITGLHNTGEYELDLRGLDMPHGVASVERMLERSRFRPPRTVAVRIDPATETSGETLFQPVGRMLLEAMKAGLVRRCHPLPDAGTGFWISLTGNPDAKEEPEANEGQESS